MSHFTCLVIGDNPDEQLEPFSEHIKVPRYKIKDLSEDEIIRFMNFYKREKPKSEVSGLDFEQLYKKFGKDWNGNDWQKDSNGVWIETSQYNPNSKWDWYELGGRWAGSIKLKPEIEEFTKPNFSWGWKQSEKEKILSENLCDQAYKHEIANLNELKPFAVLKDGQWYERGEMGWFAIVSNEKSEEHWDNEIEKLLNDLSDDTLISMYDCHI